MPSVQFFPDYNQDTRAGWNRMLLSGGLTGTGVDIAAGSVVDPNGDVIAGVAIDVPDFALYNSTTGPTSTSGDASWVTPATHFGDWILLATVDAWVPIVISGLGTAPHTVELYGWTPAINRTFQARVNGGTAQTLAIASNTSNVVKFEDVTPVDGAITIEVARHSASTGGNAYVAAGRIYEFVASPTMTVTTGDIQPETAENIVCTNFGAAPDDTTMSLNAFDDGVGTNSMALSVAVTDNLDGTYDLDFTPPALPASGSASYIRFTDEAAGITHTISIDTV